MSKELSMASVEKTLTKLTAKWQKKHGGEMPLMAVNGDGIERRTPFDDLDEKEQEVRLEDVERGNREAMRMWLEANAWLLDFFFADGPHPAKVMRRVYAWTKKFRPANIWDAGFRDLAKLLGESHAAMEWRIGVMIDGYAAGKGVVGNKMPWQRGAEVCASYSAAQKNNVNRLGGKKSQKRELIGHLAGVVVAAERAVQQDALLDARRKFQRKRKPKSKANPKKK